MLSLLVPIFKGKGDPLNPNSYRGIKFLNDEKLLNGHLREVVDMIWCNMGLCQGKGPLMLCLFWGDVVKNSDDSTCRRISHLVLLFVVMLLQDFLFTFNDLTVLVISGWITKNSFLICYVFLHEQICNLARQTLKLLLSEIFFDWQKLFKASKSATVKTSSFYITIVSLPITHQTLDIWCWNWISQN